MLSPTPIYPASEVAQFDRRHSERDPSLQASWMRLAGVGAFKRIRRQVTRCKIMIGPGANGGDGLVVATLALESGLPVRVCAPLGVSNSAVVQSIYREFESLGGQLCTQSEFLNDPSPWIDALFGVGLNRPIAPDLAQFLARLGDALFALDVPSGLDVNTGQPLGYAVKALATITFLGLKDGLFEGQGPRFAGKVFCEDLGQGQSVRRECTPCAWRISPALVSRWVSEPDPLAHKGTMGSVFVVGGEMPTLGASQLTAQACLKARAGKVWWSVDAGSATLAALVRPDLMVVPTDRPADAAAALSRAHVIAIGPGLGQSARAREWFRAALGAATPLVIDADALNLLANDEACRAAYESVRTSSNFRCVLTPHPLEAERLLKAMAIDSKGLSRRDVAVRLARAFEAVVVLKGAATVLACPNGTVWVIDCGGAELALPGSGDVLTGVVASVMARGWAPSIATDSPVATEPSRWASTLEQVALAVVWHALAGIHLSQTARGGFAASELCQALPQAYERLAELNAALIPYSQRVEVVSEWLRS